MPCLSFLKNVSKYNAKYADYNVELHPQLMLITTENTACVVVRGTKKCKDKIGSIEHKAYFGE